MWRWFWEVCPISWWFILRISPNCEFLLMKCFLAFLCCDHLAEWPISKSRFCPFLCCKICAQPHLSSKSCYLFWVLNPVFTILSRFSVGNSPAMTAIYLGVVGRALRMSLNTSPRHLRESPERFCVLILHISFPPHFCLHDFGSHGWFQFAILFPVPGRVVNLASRHADITPIRCIVTLGTWWRRQLFCKESSAQRAAAAASLAPACAYVYAQCSQHCHPHTYTFVLTRPL